MVYKFKNGWNPKGVDAQTVGEECERLANSETGLTSRSLLDASRSRDAPLHKCFEWDDAVAAENFRLRQASDIIACVVVVPDDDINERVRAFHIIDTPKRREYEHIETIVKDVDMTKQLLNDALHYLDTFKQRYIKLKSYPGMDKVFTAINELKESV